MFYGPYSLVILDCDIALFVLLFVSVLLSFYGI